MANLKVEYTAEGRDIVYRVHVHPEVFNWLTVMALKEKMAGQFTGMLYDALSKMRDDFTEDE